MPRIGLLSDTHGYLDPKIFDHLAACQEIWHAGDFGSPQVSHRLSEFRPLKGVYGNIDGHELRKIHPLHQKFTCGGLRIWITHIGGYPGNYPKIISQDFANNPVDLFICGHSHILKIMRDKVHNDLLHINPGAAGLEGFHQVRTMVRFDITDSKIEHVEVIELGKRG